MLMREDPVKMGLIRKTGVMMSTAGPAPTRPIKITSLPTARSCADHVSWHRDDLHQV